MKKLLVMLMAATVLCGCGGSAKVEKAVYEGEINGAKIRNEIEYSDDKVLKQTTVSEINYTELGLTKEVVEQTVEPFKTKYKIDGVSYTAEITEEKLVETTTIDYEKADFDKLKSAQLITSTKEDGKIMYISYEQTVKNLEKAGLTKK